MLSGKGSGVPIGSELQKKKLKKKKKLSRAEINLSTPNHFFLLKSKFSAISERGDGRHFSTVCMYLVGLNVHHYFSSRKIKVPHEICYFLREPHPGENLHIYTFILIHTLVFKGHTMTVKMTKVWPYSLKTWVKLHYTQRLYRSNIPSQISARIIILLS